MLGDYIPPLSQFGRRREVQMIGMIGLGQTTTQASGFTKVLKSIEGEEGAPWYKKPLVWICVGAGAAAITGGALLARRRKK